MTTAKNKIADALLSSAKPKYSKYRLFDEPVPTTSVSGADGSGRENISLVTEAGSELGLPIKDQPDVLMAAPAGFMPTDGGVAYLRKRRVLTSLFGLPRAIILAIYQNCKLTGSNVTNEMTMDHLVAMVGSSKGCIKTTISRLKAKKLITTEAYKVGRGGWAVYRLAEDLYCDIAKMEASRPSGRAKKPKHQI